ncbi:MAG: desulfoferrodoxin FeS4 iron-binding domain-containing protein [Deferrisomatales bacterium]
MATKVGEVYLCDICGNKVKMMEAGKGELVCCGQPMKRVEEAFKPAPATPYGA